MTAPAIDHAVKFSSARVALLDLLSDMQWHPWMECADRAGIRFGARVLELRDAGYRIETRDLDTGKSYRLVSLERSADRSDKRGRLLLARRDLESIADGCPNLTAKLEAQRALRRRP